MKIGIDISQLAYSGTGVANYLENFVDSLIKSDDKNEYVLFFSSLRGNFQFSILNFKSNPKVSIKKFKLPPSLLNLIWNKFHILPIEKLIGEVDWFITSDWTEPPANKAKKATIIYDLIVYKYPKETHANIVATQKKKLAWVKKESDLIFAISDSTKKDIEDILKIDSSKVRVVYPGI